MIVCSKTNALYLKSHAWQCPSMGFIVINCSRLISVFRSVLYVKNTIFLVCVYIFLYVCEVYNK